MAGTGVQLFQDGVVLTAAQVNGYLMDQAICVFSTPADRDNAFGGANQPTLSEGRVCYLVTDRNDDLPGNKVIQFYNGSSWVDSPQFATPDDSITNAKVKTDAAIALSKLASGTSGQIIVANAGGVPTYVTLSGDATISNAGVLTIGGNTVALGDDTTGDYVATITGGTGVTSTASVSGEGTTHTLSIGQDVATSASTTFAGITITGSASVAGNVVYNISTASVANSASITSTSSGKFIETSSASPAGTIFITGTGWTVGAQVTIMQMSASTSSASISFPGQTLRGTPLASPTVAVLRTEYSSVTLINRGTNDWYVIGDLKA
jgi:hypothetical protein